MKITGPVDDSQIPEYLHALGLPGLADIHVHFLPEPMMRKVWTYFDSARRTTGGRGRFNTALMSSLGWQFCGSSG